MGDTVIMKRNQADCIRLRDLVAKAGTFPYPPNNPAHAQQGRGFTLYQDAVLLGEDGKWSYDMPDDAELGPVRLARLSASEKSEIAAIRAKPEPV